MEGDVAFAAGDHSDGLSLLEFQIGLEISIGLWGFPLRYPNSWLVFVREIPIKTDDSGYPVILGNHHAMGCEISLLDQIYQWSARAQKNIQGLRIL